MDSQRLLLCVLALLVVAFAAPPRAFSAQAVWNKAGKVYNVAFYYDYDLSKQTQIYTFASGLNVTEITDYTNTQQFQICNKGANCQTIKYAQPAFNLYQHSGATFVRTEQMNGITCDRYSVPQLKGWNSTIWFQSGGQNFIVSAWFQRPDIGVWTYDFTSVSTTFNRNVFQPATYGATCTGLSCLAQLDLMLVLDDSDSIDNTEWNSSIAFALNVVSAFNVGPQATRIGVATFATTAVLRLPLSDDAQTVRNAIQNIQRARALTNLQGGIDTARQQLQTNGRNAAVPKAMIVLTDGTPTMPTGNPIESAVNASIVARNLNYTIYAIGVGSDIYVDVLNEVASRPSSLYVAQVADFNGLNGIRDTLVNSVCDGAEVSACKAGCDTSSFCACGVCSCTSSCSQFDNPAICNIGVCSDLGRCTSGPQPGCCNLTSWYCNNGKGEPNKVACAVNTTYPCNCQQWCGNGDTNYKCECTCRPNWSPNPSTKVCDQCTWNCNGKGKAVDACNGCNCTEPTKWGGPNCNTCVRQNSTCLNGGYVNGDCGCTCVGNWGGANCETCNLGCNGNGNFNQQCTACSCTKPYYTGNTCATCARPDATCGNGTANTNTCGCNCNTYWGQDATGNCTVCQQSQATWGLCNGRGTVNPQTCSGCTCNQACSNGQPWSADGTCQCDCQAPWSKDWAGGDCTTCTLQESFCVRGYVNRTSCNSCVCPVGWKGAKCNECDKPANTCGSKGTLNTTSCECQCQTSWTPASNCTTCGWTCNNKGNATATCDGCACPDPRTGPNCNGCLMTSNSDCQNGGNYTSSSCTCKCKVGWSGPRCGGCGWSQSNCKNGGTFSSGVCGCICPTPTTGPKLWGGDTCTSCLLADGFCKNNGTLVKSTTVCGCTCPTGWKGQDCSVCDRNSTYCGANGVFNSTSCSCDCAKDYWTGLDCKTCNRPNFCVRGTLVNTTCESCTCPTDGYFQGADCSTCTMSESCPAGKGTYNAGLCKCDCNSTTGWSGKFCDQCTWLQPSCQHNGLAKADCTGCTCQDPFWGGRFCDQCTLPGSALCKNGGYQQTNGACSCTCVNGWDGQTCESCGRPDNYCGAHGKLNKTSCKCECDQYWKGDTCGECDTPSGYCSNNGQVNTQTCNTCNCPQNGYFNGDKCELCPLTNSCVAGKGTFNANLCKCDCKDKTGWSGQVCDVCSWNNSCVNSGVPKTDCTGCTCPDPFYNGTFCETCTLPGNPSQCKNGGSPRNGVCACGCQGGWEGKTCETCGLADNYCGTQGVLNRTSCKCQCKQNYWTGDRCDQCTRPGYCQNGGDIKTATCDSCTCKGYWNGTTCNQCSLNANSCRAGSGRFNATSCKCDCISTGWTGDFCDQCVPQPNSCARGSWNDTACACNCPGGVDSLWTGTLCNTCPLGKTASCVFGEAYTWGSQCKCACKNQAVISGAYCEICTPNNALCSYPNGHMSAVDCSCVCSGNFSGEQCGFCPISQSNCVGEQSFKSSTCTCDCALSQAVCSARGAHFVYNPATCSCDCPEKWTGAGCDVCKNEGSLNCQKGINSETCACCECDEKGDCCDGCNHIGDNVFGSCNDGNPCTGQDFCLAGACQNGTVDLCSTTGETVVELTTGDSLTTGINDTVIPPVEESSGGSNVGAIVGGTVAGVAVVGAAAGAAAFILMKKTPTPAASPFEMGNVGSDAVIADNPMFQGNANTVDNTLYMGD